MSMSGRLFLAVAVGCLGTAPVACADDLADAQDAILELAKSEKLHDKSKYKSVRAAFARLFEARHADAIRKAFAADHAELTAWLAQHADLKENLYTAIDERHDKVPAALALCRDLWKQFPKELEKYPDLGVAVAVTWDNPKAIYDYRGHQVRTKSNMPEGQVDALGNFRYLVESAKPPGKKDTPGPVTFRYLDKLPWEFLIFVVDHKTPLEERKWAQSYYLESKAKSWHKDVPYDHGMLKAEQMKLTDLLPKLADRDYTLANILKYGGVCAQQADFAARVAKSCAIPAVYCSGESSYRGRHAWWMYVQLLSAKTDPLQFTLNSDGRFVGFIKDAFYTGNVLNPHTGKLMLDRDMERRLALAGRDRIGKRQVDLLMRAYPWLAEKLDWDLKQRVVFLDKCLRICPQADEPWQEFAKLVKSEEFSAAQKGIVRTHLASAMTHFKSHPDMLWRVTKHLATVYDPVEQVKLYNQAVTLFENAGRADLSCDARLQITDALAAQNKWEAAAEGLVKTIYKFPTEGRYVPKMTKKMQAVTANYKKGNDRLAGIYLDLVPKLIAYYKDDDSRFHQDLYKQAVEFLDANSMSKQAETLKLIVGTR